MSALLDFERDGRDWPNRAASRFVEADGLCWHVQEMGVGRPILLLHGAGASTHSWRHFAPLLAAHGHVLALDLPGHGFTRTQHGGDVSSLPGMARSVAAMLQTVNCKPELVIGHSAGAALMIRMALDGLIAPARLVSVNGALEPFRGLAGALFPAMARLLTANPVVPSLFAWSAGQGGAVERLIRNTGSNLDPEGTALYARLLRDPRHVAGTLAMMANWDLETLEHDLPRLSQPLLLIAAGEDRTVPPEVAMRVRDRVKGAEVVYLRRLGHLAHEERAQEVLDAVLKFAPNL